LFFGEGTDKNVWYLSSRIYGRRRKEGKGEKEGKKKSYYRSQARSLKVHLLKSIQGFQVITLDVDEALLPIDDSSSCQVCRNSVLDVLSTTNIG